MTGYPGNTVNRESFKTTLNPTFSHQGRRSSFSGRGLSFFPPSTPPSPIKGEGVHLVGEDYPFSHPQPHLLPSREKEFI